MPELSIIVPVYKSERYLKSCIDCILAQTFKDFELILVDDGSPDQSGIICDNYALQDNRIVVIHQKNSGVSAARNAGIDISKGKYIGFVDSDDFISPIMYEVLLGFIREKEVDVVACDVEIFDCEEEQVEIIHDIQVWLESRKLETTYFENKESIITDLFTRPSLMKGFSVNKIYKREILNKVRFATNMKIWEDLKFLIEVYLEEECDKAIKIALPLYYYRMHEESATHGKESFVFRGKQFKKDIWGYIKDIAPEYRGIALEYFLDSCSFHIRKYREIEKKYKWISKINILKIKCNILGWLAYGGIKKILNKNKVHRFFYEVIIRA